MMWLKGTSENKFMKLLWQLKHLGGNMCVWNMKDCRKLEEEAGIVCGQGDWTVAARYDPPTGHHSGPLPWFPLFRTCGGWGFPRLCHPKSPRLAHSSLCTRVPWPVENTPAYEGAFAQKFARLCSRIDVLVLWIFSPSFHPLSSPTQVHKQTAALKGIKILKYSRGFSALFQKLSYRFSIMLHYHNFSCFLIFLSHAGNSMK